METLSNAVKNPPATLENVMSFFSGNPFSTPVGQKIEQATDPTLASENWQLNMEICDMINSSEETSKDAIRAIKKRFQQNTNKNYTVIMYTLTVLETCVKNCSKKFHLLVCNKDFVNELVKLIGPKNDPPTVVQEKVLGLIQSWADTFKGQGPEVQGVVQVYEDLKYKGIEFPPTNLDDMAPILTPKRSVETPRPASANPEPILHPVDLGRNNAIRQQTPTKEEKDKLKREMTIVQGNMTVFSEILSEMKKPEDQSEGNLQDLLFLEELYVTSKEMQRRIGDLLSTINSDELVGELLHLNDELNNCFLRYGRYRKNIEKTTTAMTTSSNKGKSDEPSLIDFVSDDVSKISSGAIPKTTPVVVGDDSEFDSFAAARTGGDSKKSSATAGLVSQQLASDKKILPAATNAPSTTNSMTSSEFDKFLEERAKKP